MSTEKPWYTAGLRFKCTGCGNCCTGRPGYVWLEKGEAKRLADHLDITLDEFHERYTRRVSGSLSLKEDSKTYDCVFLKGKRCSVYEARPKQCRDFPWWIENLESPEAWKRAAVHCEGINHPDAPLIPLSEIQEQTDGN